MTALTDVQIRKDISVFGKAGKPRVGYDTRRLKQLLEDYVIQNVVHVVLFGVGNLGSAILRYPGFHQDKIKMVAAFDSDPGKAGKSINGISIYPLDQARMLIQKKHVEIGVIAVPKQVSQQIADLLVSCGIEGIVNFSPTNITVPKGTFVKNIDLAVEFLSLFCDMNAKKGASHA